MPKIFSYFKEHRGTGWMLVFVLAFYSVMLWAHEEPPAKDSTRLEGRLTMDELKDMEKRFLSNIQSQPQGLRLAALLFLLVLTAGALINFYLLARRLGGETLILGMPLGPTPVPWDAGDVFGVFVFLFFCEAMLLFWEITIAAVLGLKDFAGNFLLMTNSLLRDLFVAAMVVWLVTKKFGRNVSEIGLTPQRLFKNVFQGFLAYTAVIPWLLVIVIVISGLLKIFSLEPPPQPVVEIYLKESKERHLIYFTVFVAMVGPVIEEVFFRGFTYTAFRSKFGVGRAMLLSSVIFAALHFNWVALFPIFFLGLFLAYLYEKTGSLTAPMTVHMLHNLVMVFFVLGFKGLAQ